MRGRGEAPLLRLASTEIARRNADDRRRRLALNMVTCLVIAAEAFGQRLERPDRFGSFLFLPTVVPVIAVLRIHRSSRVLTEFSDSMSVSIADRASMRLTAKGDSGDGSDTIIHRQQSLRAGGAYREEAIAYETLYVAKGGEPQEDGRDDGRRGFASVACPLEKELAGIGFVFANYSASIFPNPIFISTCETAALSLENSSTSVAIRPISSANSASVTYRLK